MLQTLIKTVNINSAHKVAGISKLVPIGVDNSSIDNKYFVSTDYNSHRRPHSSLLPRQEHSGKKIFKFFCRHTFLAEAIVTDIARPPFWAKPFLAIPSCGHL